MCIVCARGAYRRSRPVCNVGSAVGFKGESWEGEDYSADTAHPHPATLRPCYFGMCVDEYDNYTTDRIVVGYSGAKQGACVREMVSRQLAGEPVDVPKSERMLRATSVEQRAGRTVRRRFVAAAAAAAAAAAGRSGLARAGLSGAACVRAHLRR
jgi:hypothetical protein